jgi:hypothetical protein
MSTCDLAYSTLPLYNNLPPTHFAASITQPRCHPSHYNRTSQENTPSTARTPAAATHYIEKPRAFSANGVYELVSKTWARA